MHAGVNGADPTDQVLNPLAQACDARCEYDDGGAMARSGRVLPALLAALDALPFYQQPAGPKSLGFEFARRHIFPLLDAHPAPARDALRTYTEHAATQIANALALAARQRGARAPHPPRGEREGLGEGQGEGEGEGEGMGEGEREGAACAETSSVLVTGGGAFNAFLLERIEAHLAAMAASGASTPSPAPFPAPAVVPRLHIPSRDQIEFKESLIFGLLGVLRVMGAINCLRTVTGATHDVCGGDVHQPL